MAQQNILRISTKRKEIDSGYSIYMAFSKCFVTILCSVVTVFLCMSLVRL